MFEGKATSVCLPDRSSKGRADYHVQNRHGVYCIENYELNAEKGSLYHFRPKQLRIEHTQNQTLHHEVSVWVLQSNAEFICRSRVANFGSSSSDERKWGWNLIIAKIYVTLTSAKRRVCQQSSENASDASEGDYWQEEQVESHWC